MQGLNNATSPSLELVKTALDKISDSMLVEEDVNKGRVHVTDAVVFTQENADKAAVVATTLGGGGYVRKVAGSTVGGNDVQTSKNLNKKASTPKVVTIAEFKADIPVSRTFMEDQQHGAVARSLRQSVSEMKATNDQNGFAVWTDGLTGATSFSTTIDGVALFSNSHVNENGDTVDNYETGALTDDTMNSTVVSLRNQKNQAGVKVGYEARFALTSNSQHNLLVRVTKSVLRQGSGNNDLNYWSEYYPGLQAVYNQFVDDGSTTAVFVGATNHDVFRYEREQFSTTLVPWQYDTNDQYIYKLREREEVDALSYVGTVALTGV